MSETLEYWARGLQIGVPVLLVTGWLTAPILLSRLSRWYRLSEKYRTKRESSSETKGFCSGRVGDVYYSLTLRLSVTREGLYLATSRFIPLGHPPLRIAWSDLQVKSMGTFMFSEVVVFRVGVPVVCEATLPAWVIKAAKTVLPEEQYGALCSLHPTSDSRQP
jgi:hypothetical protein